MIRQAPGARAADLERHARLGGVVLGEIFEQALRRLRPKLATRMGGILPIHVPNIGAYQLEDAFQTDLGSSAAFWVSYPVIGGSGAIIVGLEGALIALLMGRMFGEVDVGSSTWTPRAPTRVELAVGMRLARDLVDAVTHCWTGGPAPRVTEGRNGPPSRVADGLDPEAVMLSVTVELEIETAVGRIAVLVPDELVLGELGRVDEEPARAMHIERVYPIDVEFVVELARLRMSIGQLKDLKPGDEIPLGLVRFVEARVEGVPAFVGQPGETGGQRSFRITERARSASHLTGVRR